MIPRDKILHLIAGGLVGIAALLLIPDPMAPILSALVVGVAKEAVWDAYFKKGTPEVEDAVWTFMGGVLVALLFELVV